MTDRPTAECGCPCHGHEQVNHVNCPCKGDPLQAQAQFKADLDEDRQIAIAQASERQREIDNAR